MQATAVCKRLLDLSLRRPRTGAVHSVFDHAVNLDFGVDGLIGLIAQGKPLTPYAVSVRTDVPFAQAGVRADMAAQLLEGKLLLPEAGIEIDLARAEPIELSLDAIALLHTMEAKCALERLILDALAQTDAGESLAPLVMEKGENVFTRFLAPRLARLTCAVSLGAWEEAAAAAANCAGCGMGLTPSSDDLLSGYLSTLHLLYRNTELADAKAHLLTIAQAAANRTNRISGTFLLHSGQALANAAICDLFRATFTFLDLFAAKRAIERVLAIGSTSGADLLTGIVLALRQNIGGSTS